VRALGACQAGLYPDTQGMLEALATGRSLLAYNVLGTYAEAFARRNPEVGVLYLSDYTLVMSRVAFIAAQCAETARCPLVARPPAFAGGPAPAGGSREACLACELIRLGPDRPVAVGQQLGAAARPIALGPALLAHLDRSSMRHC
jgi:iron(III) transport system substrate-binding protein